jgi:hypothetical protein
MSLDNIQLPPIVVQDLFKNSLVDLNIGKQSISNNDNNITIAYLGSNEKAIGVLVHNDDNLYLPDDELQFLMGILTACKLSMSDVAVINIMRNEAITYKVLQSQLKSKTILLFDVSPQQLQLPLQFPHYQIQKYDGGQYLAAPSLSLIQKDKAEKTKLWNCLKQLFVA